MSRFQLQNDDDDNDEVVDDDYDLQDEDGFADDMEALRQACMLSGTNPTNFSPSAGSSGEDDDSYGAVGISNSESEDDFELFRNVQNRFAMSADSLEPLSLKPLCALPPVSDDEEDDFETLCAVRRRFAAYDNNTNNNQDKPDNSKPEIEVSDDLLVDRNNACKVFPDSDNANASLSSDNMDKNELDDTKSSTLELNYSSFPQSAQAFIDAIKRNRSCQKFVRNKLTQIEARIEENKKLKERVKILKDFQVSCKKIAGRALALRKDYRIQLISTERRSKLNDSKANDKKVSAVHNGPAENSHVANYRMALTNFPVSLDRKKWTDAERESLGKGIRQQFQEMLFQVSMDQLSGSEGPGDTNNLDNILTSIRDLEISPEKIREFLPKVNWDELASSYVPGHSGAECEARWLNFEDPLINHGTWTNEEDKHLLFIVQEKGVTNWFNIAVSLGTNRTPSQCLSRFQRSLNARILKREWTDEEDAQLRVAVETYGESNWQTVASTLVGRTGTQCSNRWMKTLHPGRRRVGRWTVDESKRLKVAVKFFGPKNWKKIAKFVPNRTPAQCRERWFNCLDPSSNRGEWTEEEDLRLKAAIRECGYRWSKVAERLPYRTDNQCWRRWKVLCPQEVRLLQAARKTRKAALISNFVDRESERPALGVNDFIPLPMTGPASDPEKMDQSRTHQIKSRGAESRKQKDATPGDALKIRSKRHRKKVSISRDELPGITDDTQAGDFGGSLSVVVETGRCSGEKSHAERGQDHPSSNLSLMPLTTTRGEKVVNELVVTDCNSENLLLSLSRTLEAGVNNGDIFQTVGCNRTTSSKKRRNYKQHSRISKCTESGEGRCVLPGTISDANPVVNDHLDSNLLTITTDKDNRPGQPDASRKKRVLRSCSEFTECAGSCPVSLLENAELRVTNTAVEGYSLDRTTTNVFSKASELPRRRKSRIEPSEEQASDPHQQDRVNKSKLKGKSYSEKVFGTKEDDDNITLSSFLSNKSKKKRVESAQNADRACSPSSVIMGLEALSRVDQPSNENKMHSLVQDGEAQTSRDGKISGNVFLHDMHVHHSKRMRTELSRVDTSNCVTVAPVEGVKEPGGIIQDADLEPGDITLASLLSKKPNRRNRILGKNGYGAHSPAPMRKKPDSHSNRAQRPHGGEVPENLLSCENHSIRSSGKPTIIGGGIEPGGLGEQSNHCRSANGKAILFYRRRSRG